MISARSLLYFVPLIAITLGVRWILHGPATDVVSRYIVGGNNWAIARRDGSDNGNVETLVVIRPPQMGAIPTEVPGSGNRNRSNKSSNNSNNNSNNNSGNSNSSGNDNNSNQAPPAVATVVTVAKPVNQDSTCQRDYIDFSQSDSLSKFQVPWCPENAYIEDGELKWRLTAYCGTTVVYPKTFQYGKVEGRIKMAAGSGAVTAFILVGPPPADEIDFEWVGRSTDSVQTTYYVRAQAVDATPQIHYPNNTMGHDLSSEYHDYGIELTESAIKWYMDGQVIRTLTKSPPQPFPNNANQLRMGIWDGTHTSGWAGAVDWSSSPFTASIQWLRITPYC